MFCRDTVTITRDAWNEMMEYIKGLEDQVETLEYELTESYKHVEELEEKLNGVA